MALTPLAELSDVEIYLKHKTPAELETYANRKLAASSNVLRMLFRAEGNDLDEKLVDDELLSSLVNDTVAVNVAIDIRKEEAKLGEDVDLSAFSQFTQSAAGYSFSGTWQGNPEDVFFTVNQLANLGIGQSAISTFHFNMDSEKQFNLHIRAHHGAPLWW